MNVLSTPSANIVDLTFLELQAQLAVWKEPRFRAQQLWKWIYVHLAADFEQMSNLPRALRDRLARHYRLHPLVPVDNAISDDLLTHKVLFRLPDGQSIESVMMEYDRRRTVCVSSQVGCPVRCAFCATGQSGYVRDLGAAEIIAQPLHFAGELKHRDEAITNIVVMGMGEPLMNYEAVWQAVETWNDHRGLNVGARKITLSTAGYVPGIRRLSAEELQVGLAVSLHAAEDGLRSQLVPLNRAYPLSELLTACREYTALTGRRLTIEYALIDGVNDSVAQALRLADLLRGLLCLVNLIPLNPTAGGSYRPSPRARVHAFQQVLVERHIETTVRLRRGIDIQAGCGQLRQRHQEGQDGHPLPGARHFLA